MLSVRVVNTISEFESLSESWNALLNKSSVDTIFLTWEWLYTWARHYVTDKNLFILLGYEGDQIVGIAPFYLTEVGHHGVLPVRQIEFLGTGEVCSSYLDFIVETKMRNQFLQSVYNFFFKPAKSDWDVLHLAEIPSESPSIDVLYQLAEDDGKVVEIIGHTCCPIIRLAKTVNEFLSCLSSNERYNLKRKERRLSAYGCVQYRRTVANAEVRKQMDTFINLHERRWELTETGGCFKSKRFLQFHKELSERLSDKGWVSLDFLSVSGEQVAGIYGFSYKNRYYFYLPGHKPGLFPEASPGILLLFKCVSQAIEHGHKEFDLLQGPSSYKMAWANSLRRSLTLRVYNGGLRSAALKLADGGKQSAKVLFR